MEEERKEPRRISRRQQVTVMYGKEPIKLELSVPTDKDQDWLNAYAAVQQRKTGGKIPAYQIYARGVVERLRPTLLEKDGIEIDVDHQDEKGTVILHPKDPELLKKLHRHLRTQLGAVGEQFFIPTVGRVDDSALPDVKVNNDFD